MVGQSLSNQQNIVLWIRELTPTVLDITYPKRRILDVIAAD